ncbi:mitotic-spindle organizing protein 1 [Vombatus ursinus]|nr:mitotic-spindle organizing protein 1 [Vombatus ursinus]
MSSANQGSGLPGAQPIAAPSRPRTGQSHRNRVGNSNGNFALHAPIVTGPGIQMNLTLWSASQRQKHSARGGVSLRRHSLLFRVKQSSRFSSPWRAVAMAGSNSGAAVAAANLNAVRETMDVLLEISRILNTGLDMETLSICVRLCEQGINPEALSSVIKELRKATEALKAAENMTS